nr:MULTISPECIES: DUF6492 family protein [unclassified Marinobacterium]
MEFCVNTLDQNRKIAFVTCSYGPDFQRCSRLCASMDEFVDSGFEHVIIVPKRDMAQFSKLQGGRRKVVSVEKTVPGLYLQLPFSNKWWLDSQLFPVRGWIMQQITKLSAGFATEADYLVFTDSDLQFIRPFSAESVLKDGELRLHRIPGVKNDGVHLKWHHKAGALLGTEQAYAGADYVGQLITWRRDVLLLMLDQIEKATGKRWYHAVGHSLTFSEYITYGMFAEKVLTKDSGHYFEERDLCHCCWTADEAADLKARNANIDDQAVALLLQSNLGLTANQERELIQIAKEMMSFNQKQHDRKSVA